MIKFHKYIATSNQNVFELTKFQIFTLIYLQKFGIYGVSVSMLCLFGSIFYGLQNGNLRISLTNIMFFLVFALAAIFAQFFSPYYSLSSLFFIISLYFVFNINVGLSAQDYRNLMKSFSLFMTIPTCLVFAQNLYQLLHGAGNSISIDAYIPKVFLLSGYMPESSTETWKTWNRPNGVFFLEPSFCSAFLALAFLSELMLLRRFLFAGFFFSALIATNGATGWIIVLVAVSLSILSRWPLATLFAGALLLVVLAISVRYLPDNFPLVSRLDELDNTSSSGYGRLLQPFEVLVSLLEDGSFIFSGYGAGQIDASYGAAWPITKLIYEYGMITAILYIVFFIAVLLPTMFPILAISLFIVFNFTGGYLLSPFFVEIIFIFCLSCKRQHYYIMRSA